MSVCVRWSVATLLSSFCQRRLCQRLLSFNPFYRLIPYQITEFMNSNFPSFAARTCSHLRTFANEMCSKEKKEKTKDDGSGGKNKQTPKLTPQGGNQQHNNVSLVSRASPDLNYLPSGMQGIHRSGRLRALPVQSAVPALFSLYRISKD